MQKPKFKLKYNLPLKTPKHRSIIMDVRLADSKELANNIQTKRENNTRKAKNKRHKLNQKAINNSNDSTDQLAQAAAKGDVDNDTEQNLDIRDHGEQDAKSGDDDLESNVFSMQIILIINAK